MWQKLKNFFSKSQQSLTTSSEQTIEAISENKSEPVIKKLKRQVNFRKEPNYRQNCSSEE